MKFVIVLFALFALASARPNAAEIEHLESEVLPDHFNYALKTSDGTQTSASGVLNNIGTDHESLAVKGSFSFVADDGKTYTVNYIADENGFQPQGAHIPTI